MNSKPPKIAYFVEKFPSPTQTFVYREVLGLRAQGFSPKLFSIWPSDPKDLSPEAIPLSKDTFYIFPNFLLTFLIAHLKYLLTKPIRYLKAFSLIITQPNEPMINRWRSIRHFIYGILAIQEMEKQKIRHIHTHFGWSASSIALVANQLLNIPFSLTLHAHGIYIDRLLLKAKMQRSRFVVTISEFNKKYLCDLFPEYRLSEKIHVVHCGLNSDIFRPPTKKRKHINNFTIVGIGQLDPRKGFHVLVETCRLLSEKNINYRCHVLGEGPERQRLEGMVKKYNLNGRVILPGHTPQEELRLILETADVSVLPCIWDKSGDIDGIPVALMETMAMGIPTISTNISGIPELIKHEHNGLLTSPEDYVGLANFIQRLKDDRELGLRLGREGRKTIIDDFNIFKSAEQMRELFCNTVYSSTT